MPQIRPISDLRNNFAEISRIVHNTSDVMYLTKNGYGDMVVMSVELFEELGIAALLVDKAPKKAVPAEKQDKPEIPNQQEAPAAELKIQNPLSLWKKTLSDLAAK